MNILLVLKIQLKWQRRRCANECKWPQNETKSRNPVVQGTRRSITGVRRGKGACNNALEMKCKHKAEHGKTAARREQSS